MDFTKCSLYGLSNIKQAESLLNFNATDFISPNAICRDYYKLYILNNKRLTEQPLNELKRIQKQIYIELMQLSLPNYLYSCKNKSCLKGVQRHSVTSNYMVKIDIKNFFPHTHRDKVYRFWKEDMKMAGEVANIITNLTTINTKKAPFYIMSFYDKKGIKVKNHIPTGSSTSTILSFLVNYRMFEQINDVVTQNHGVFTLYADDMLISGCKNVNSVFNQVRKILSDNMYKISLRKSIHFSGKPVYALGTVLCNKSMYVPNNKNHEIRKLKSIINLSESDKLRLLGLQQYSSQIKKMNLIKT